MAITERKISRIKKLYSVLSNILGILTLIIFSSIMILLIVSILYTLNKLESVPRILYYSIVLPLIIAALLGHIADPLEAIVTYIDIFKKLGIRILYVSYSIIIGNYEDCIIIGTAKDFPEYTYIIKVPKTMEPVHTKKIKLPKMSKARGFEVEIMNIKVRISEEELILPHQDEHWVKIRAMCAFFPTSEIEKIDFHEFLIKLSEAFL